MHATSSHVPPAGVEGLLVAASLLDSPPRVTIEGPVDSPLPPAGPHGGPWYLRRDVQAEVGASHAVLRALGVYSGSLVEARTLPIPALDLSSIACVPDRRMFVHGSVPALRSPSHSRFAGGIAAALANAVQPMECKRTALGATEPLFLVFLKLPTWLCGQLRMA
jgi:hypothetical protein